MLNVSYGKERIKLTCYSVNLREKNVLVYFVRHFEIVDFCAISSGACVQTWEGYQFTAVEYNIIVR